MFLMHENSGVKKKKIILRKENLKKFKERYYEKKDRKNYKCLIILKK